MRHSDSSKLKTVPLVLLMFGALWGPCAAQVNREEANTPPDAHGGGGGGAFFALRSCHQLLRGDSGEFFSPDYLCSNPALWCNWTIRVDAGKRIHLQLEDLAPGGGGDDDDDGGGGGGACHLKRDQIHVDEPALRAPGREVLQGCWREARYTSSSDTLNVVLLIGGWPTPPYRGIYGRYQAFGPPVAYDPRRDGGTEGHPEPGLGPMHDLGDQILESDPGAMYDYDDQYSAEAAELPRDADAEVGGSFSLQDPLTAGPTAPLSTQGTSRSGRGVASTPEPDPAGPESAAAAAQRGGEEAAEDESGAQNRSEQEKPVAAAAGGSEPGADGENRPEVSEVSEASHQRPPTSEGPEPGPGPEPGAGAGSGAGEAEQTHPLPGLVEPLSDHRGSSNIRNHSESPHLPGDHLFEVAVEVFFSEDVDEPWDERAKSLLLAVKTLVSEQLEALHTPLSISSKRIKRLNAGVLYILWLQIAQGPGSQQVHRVVHAAMQGLIATHVGPSATHRKAVITSVSTADVNECGTQLVLCDVNADCVDRFGSYSCRCRPGFLDESRLGSGGTACVDARSAGCGSGPGLGPSAETKAVYAVFFLLSSLVLMLLAAGGALYHRHRRGTLLVRCHDDVSSPDPNNNNNHHHHHDGYPSPAGSDLPPPPPPARGPREGWPPLKERGPAVDLPLLRFSPLLPPPPDGKL